MTKRQPVYDINEWLLNGTEVGALMGWPNPEGIRPFVPVQQQPETNDRTSENPYVVYSWRTIGGLDQWWVRTDEVTYVIWGRSVEQLSEIANEIVDHLIALDESAQDLMEYLGHTGRNLEWVFHYIRVVGSFSPDPASQEAGRLGWIVTFRYEYSPVNGKHIG